MKTENSKEIESKKITYQFTDKINIITPNKNIALVNLIIYYSFLMGHILFQTFKITLNFSLKGMKIQLTILLYKLTSIELKIWLFLKQKWPTN